MASLTSSLNMQSKSLSPVSPLKQRPHATGLFKNMASAPNAKHFITSVPLLIPESINIWELGYDYFTYLEMFWRTRIVEGAVDDFWWDPFEIQIESAPFLRAFNASSSHIIPFTIILIFYLT